ncbi:alcohol dehydrogenase catalytic domain-containing protein [Phytomonospora endophytica]|uniref:NADPH2:quinone reductase n=1 Tax=Phytomonospora endophytica TaxID=714109 RepID=A0A841FJI5_9ACTN|nr:zinc-binding dehydrogenase [Phytomonospora endophytica]MBB6033998.1 NADPH2:quinone reductase [Phytomonospora endophytica]GIG64481.1 oxidoreductase [Phytomonospora endophytica]
MHAVRQYEVGPAETLRFEEVPDPVAGPGQLLIRVKAAGVHLLDAAIRGGTAGGHPFADPELPMTPGREVAGVVEAVGDGVDTAWIGRRVVTHLGIASGGYAELAVREAEAVHAIPDGLGDAAAVALVGTGRTTVGILDVAALGGDDVVLVTAAAGGIGSLLVQAAAGLGAVVVAAASGDKLAHVKSVAPQAITVDYTRPDWPELVREALGGRAITVAFDSVGGAAGRETLDLLGAGGRFIMYGWSAGEATKLTADDLYAKSLQVTVALGPRMVARPGGIRSLETQALAEGAAGRLIALTEEFPLAEAAAAHTALEGRSTVGKVVLVP